MRDQLIYRKIVWFDAKVCSRAYSKPDNGFIKYQLKQIIVHGFVALQGNGRIC